MCDLQMEREVHRSTDIDIRPHLAQLCVDLQMPSLADALLEDSEIDVEKAIDFIEEANQLYNPAY